MSRFLSLALLVSLPLGGRAAEPDGAEFFEKKVRPLVAEHCYGCHSAKAKDPKAGLRLDSRAGILKGGARGPAVVPGAPEKSRLIEAVSYKNVDLQMPPRGKLSDAAIADLTAWVKMGAPWPGGDAPVVVEKKPGFDLQKRKAEHWCWQPVRHLDPPDVRDNSWPLVPADRFILARLEAAGLKPAPPADRRTWLRRVYFDLIGLPPTPAEIEAFEQAAIRHPQSAMAEVVDRLLASPHYGERWARHWLDLVRYAETKGHEFDPIIPNAYQYRDYVIRAFNTDVPYNQFVTEHIAGDLLRQPRLSAPDGFNESVLGTGFWFLGEEVHSPVDIRADECDRIDNKIDVFSKTFLALTVSCARCHDHKFDAISQKDYYALAGFLLSSAYRQVRFDSLEHNKRIEAELYKLRFRHGEAIQSALGATIKPGVEHLKENLLAARAAIRAGKPGDTEIIRAWVKYLNAARNDPWDPFHAWVTLSALGDKEFAERVKNLVSAVRKCLEDVRDDPDSPFEMVASSFDHPNPWFGASLWRPDDVGYDSTGVVLGRGAGHPIRWVQNDDLGSAFRRDPFWQGLALKPGAESDHGVLGATPRYGKLLRSPNFTLNKDKVLVLAKGRGRMYAAVDSHTLIAGPLHGRLVRDFDTGGKWRWVAQDLRPYKGHRMHLEVWPTDDSSFAVGPAFQSDPSPQSDRMFVDLRSPSLPRLGTWLAMGRPHPTTVDEFAEFYQTWFQDLCSSLEAGDAEDPSFIPIGNVPLDHPELFGIKEFDKVFAAAKPLIEGQGMLAKQVRRESRLAPAMWDGTGVDDHIHIRGSHKALGEVVPRRFLESLVGTKSITDLLIGSGRDKLAVQVTDPRVNPLIARVIVNRVWHHLFGRGIVASVDNFGVMGDRPTHPELLDFLAERFVEQGWSIKRLIRELVLSATYQQASAAPQPADPENKLLHAARIKRLQGEVIRDAMLALSGRLDPKVEGPPVPIYLGNIPEARGRPNVDGPLDGAGRRSIYIAVRRNFLSPFMLAFDTPSPFSTMGRRSVSNVPAQALILMNDPFVHQQAERWGRRVAAEAGDVGAKVEQMYLAAFARRPTAEESQRSREFVEARGSDARAWGDLAHVLFNVKEFIYLP